jgi:hypothetical protein
MKCVRCSNEADIEDQDICGHCAMEDLFEEDMKAKAEADPNVKIAFDCKLRKPGCVIVQAMFGADNSLAGQLFNVESWLLAPTPDMHVYNLPLSHWKRVAEVVNEENPLPKI